MLFYHEVDLTSPGLNIQTQSGGDRLIAFANQKRNAFSCVILLKNNGIFKPRKVGRVGLEPTRGNPRRILSPLRLPIPPPPLAAYFIASLQIVNMALLMLSLLISPGYSPEKAF